MSFRCQFIASLCTFSSVLRRNCHTLHIVRDIGTARALTSLSTHTWPSMPRLCWHRGFICSFHQPGDSHSFFIFPQESNETQVAMAAFHTLPFLRAIGGSDRSQYLQRFEPQR